MSARRRRPKKLRGFPEASPDNATDLRNAAMIKARQAAEYRKQIREDMRASKKLLGNKIAAHRAEQAHTQRQKLRAAEHHNKVFIIGRSKGGASSPPKGAPSAPRRPRVAARASSTPRPPESGARRSRFSARNLGGQSQPPPPLPQQQNEEALRSASAPRARIRFGGRETISHTSRQKQQQQKQQQKQQQQQQQQQQQRSASAPRRSLGSDGREARLRQRQARRTEMRASNKGLVFEPQDDSDSDVSGRGGNDEGDGGGNTTAAAPLGSGSRRPTVDWRAGLEEVTAGTANPWRSAEPRSLPAASSSNKKVHNSKLMGDAYVHWNARSSSGFRPQHLPPRVGLRPRDGFEGPARLHVAVHAASGLKNVQLLGWQDPMVRVWTTCTLKERWADNETAPSMNTHLEAQWGGEALTLEVGMNRPRLKKQQLVVQVRNYNGSALPSDVIGTGTFPLAELRDRENEESISLYSVPSAMARFVDSHLGGHKAHGASKDTAQLRHSPVEAVKAGEVRLTLRLQLLSAAEHEWEVKRVRMRRDDAFNNWTEQRKIETRNALLANSGIDQLDALLKESEEQRSSFEHRRKEWLKKKAEKAQADQEALKKIRRARGKGGGLGDKRWERGKGPRPSLVAARRKAKLKGRGAGGGGGEGEGGEGGGGDDQEEEEEEEEEEAEDVKHCYRVYEVRRRRDGVAAVVDNGARRNSLYQQPETRPQSPSPESPPPPPLATGTSRLTMEAIAEVAPVDFAPDGSRHTIATVPHGLREQSGAEEQEQQEEEADFGPPARRTVRNWLRWIGVDRPHDVAEALIGMNLEVDVEDCGALEELGEAANEPDNLSQVVQSCGLSEGDAHLFVMSLGQLRYKGWDPPPEATFESEVERRNDPHYQRAQQVASSSSSSSSSSPPLPPVSMPVSIRPLEIGDTRLATFTTTIPSGRVQTVVRLEAEWEQQQQEPPQPPEKGEEGTSLEMFDFQDVYLPLAKTVTAVVFVPKGHGCPGGSYAHIPLPPFTGPSDVLDVSLEITAELSIEYESEEEEEDEEAQNEEEEEEEEEAVAEAVEKVEEAVDVAEVTKTMVERGAKGKSSTDDHHDHDDDGKGKEEAAVADSDEKESKKKKGGILSGIWNAISMPSSSSSSSSSSSPSAEEEPKNSEIVYDEEWAAKHLASQRVNLEKIIEEEGYGEKWAREKLKEEEMRHAMDNDHVLENGYDDEWASRHLEQERYKADYENNLHDDDWAAAHLQREQKVATQLILLEEAQAKAEKERLETEHEDMACEELRVREVLAVEAWRKREAKLATWGKIVDYFEKRRVAESLTLRGLFDECDVNGDQIVTPEEFIRRMMRHGVIVKRAEMTPLMRELDPDDEGIVFFGPFCRALRANKFALRQRRFEEVHGDGRDHHPPSHQASLLKRGVETGSWTQDWRQDPGVVVGDVVVEPPLRQSTRAVVAAANEATTAANGDGNGDVDGGRKETRQPGGHERTLNQMKHVRSRQERRSRAADASAAKEKQTRTETAKAQRKRREQSYLKRAASAVPRTPGRNLPKKELSDSNLHDQPNVTPQQGTAKKLTRASPRGRLQGHLQAYSLKGFKDDGIGKMSDLGLDERQDLPARAGYRREQLRQRRMLDSLGLPSGTARRRPSLTAAV